MVKLTRFIFSAALIITIPFAATGQGLFNDSTTLDIGGAVRFNAFYKNWEGEEANQKKYGDFNFDTWRINVLAEHSNITLATEYRFYAGYHFFKYGWLGYDFPGKEGIPGTELRLGLNQVPFGLLPYASHNWFAMMPYYIGLEDDHDMGLKLIHEKQNWDFRLAFYKNAEGTFSGSSDASARYSYDIVGENEEVNQGNARVAYELGNTEIGISGQYGQLYNSVTQEMGDQYAFAVHADGNYGQFNLKAQALQYEYNPDHVSGSEDFVLMGAYDFPYQVAKKGRMYVGGISYKVPVEWGPVRQLTFYNDFTFFDKALEEYRNSQMNVAGVMIEAGKLVAYLDVASGHSHPWIGPVWSEALSRGPGSTPELKEPKPEWATRYNLNIGYYF